MTKLLEQALKKVKQLPDSDQDALAAIILDELEDELQWEQAFSRSQDVLARLAREAMSEYKAGKTEELDPDTL